MKLQEKCTNYKIYFKILPNNTKANRYKIKPYKKNNKINFLNFGTGET